MIFKILAKQFDKRMWRIIFCLGIVGLITGGSFYAGFAAGTYAEQNQGPLSLASLSLVSHSSVDDRLIEEAWDFIHEKYVLQEKINDEDLIYGAVRGMVQALDDPYSAFFDPREKEEFLDEVNGKFEGIGAEIGIRDSELTVVAPLPGTPAERASLRAGDKILRIDDKITQDMSVEEGVSRIRGTAGTQVILLIQRNGEEPYEQPITRAVIHIPSLRWELRSNGIGVITFYQFGQEAADNFGDIAQQALRANARGIILDLRNNPGGYLDAAVDIAGWLLPEQSVVVAEEFAGGVHTEHRATGPGFLQHIPIIVLINEGSASASEILAGALAHHRSAPLVGEKTFGKGSVQELADLAAGSSIKLTIARWLTPAGVSIQDTGIEPTVEIARDPAQEGDAQLDKAIEIMVSLIK